MGRRTNLDPDQVVVSLRLDGRTDHSLLVKRGKTAIDVAGRMGPRF
jgi:hypothetical protein